MQINHKKQIILDKNIIIADLIFKYLKDELSFDEKNIFDVWLENPDNRKYLQQLQDSEIIYTNIQEMWKTGTKTAFEELRVNVRRQRRLSVFKYAIGAASSVILILGAYFGLSNRSEKQVLSATKDAPVAFGKERAILETSRGDIYYVADSVEQSSIISENKPIVSKKLNTLKTLQQKLTSVTLSDGTHVWLNAESVLEYPDQFIGNERIVNLSGEAFFEIAHNVDKPFIVKVKNADIRVLGTVFNLNATNNHSVITLVEGAVQIKNDRENVVTLSPGQQAFLNDKNDINVRNVDVSYYIAWRKNLFAFENQQLTHIIADIAKWYGMAYEFDNDTLQKVRYTSIIRKYDDVTEALNVLNEMNEFSAHVAGNTIRISEK